MRDAETIAKELSAARAVWDALGQSNVPSGDILRARQGAGRMRAIAFGLIFVGQSVTCADATRVMAADRAVLIAAFFGTVVCIIKGW